MATKVQVLVAAMHQTDDSLVAKMGLQTDAIVANQCEDCSEKRYVYDGFEVAYYNRPHRGVGLNRNVALLHSGEGILTFADDDMQFVDGYGDLIARAFEELPKADAIIFNIETVGIDVGRRKNVKAKRVRFFNALNYGAARLSVRAASIKRANVLFHTCFGGGTRYNAGEDSIFITDMLKKGLKVYVYPVCIASVDQTTSTWFKGYDEKYFHDKGAFFKAISKRWAKLLCLQDLLRHRGMYKEGGISLSKAYRLEKQGIKAFQHLKKFEKTEE